jgi:hypothetical protein
MLSHGPGMTVLDCFACARNDTTPPSRGTLRPSFAWSLSLLKTEGAGNAGCFVHPQPCVRTLKSTQASHHRFTETLRHSLRNGFNGFLRALLGDRALLPPSSARCRSIVANLASASGCRDHTTSPSARSTVRLRCRRVHRIPRPTFVTTAKRPSYQARDGGNHASDLASRSIFTRCDISTRRANHSVSVKCCQGFSRLTDAEETPPSSCPDLFPASTSCFLRQQRKRGWPRHARP